MPQVTYTEEEIREALDRCVVPGEREVYIENLREMGQEKLADFLATAEVTEEGEAFYTEKIEFDDPVSVTEMNELIRLAVDFGRATKSDEVAAAFDDLLEDGYETPE